MVVLTNKKDKSTVGFLMTLVPDKAYLESTHFDALRSNYKQWQKGFSGYVYYHTLDGNFNNAWKFANGKVIKEVTQLIGTDLNLDMRVKKKAATETCIYTTYEVWSQNCTDYSSNGEYDAVACGEWYYDGTTTEIECFPSGDTGGGGSGGGDNGGNAGNGGYSAYFDCSGTANGSAYLDGCQQCVGGNTGKTDCTPISSSKFSTNYLTTEEIAFLNLMYTKLEEDCLYKFINQTMNQGNMPYGTIKMQVTMAGEGNVSNLGCVEFKDGTNTTYSTFKHEWRHLYQRELNDMSTFGNKKGMMEFENAVYKDIETFKKGTPQNLKLSDMDEGTYSWIWVLEQQGVPGNETTRRDYISWIKRLGTGSVVLTLPTELAIFQQWANLFGQYSTGYGTNMGFQYSGVDYPLNALSNLILKLNDCNK